MQKSNFSLDHSDVMLLADIIETLIETFDEEDKVNPIYFVCLPGCIWDACLNDTKIEFKNFQEAVAFFWFLMML